MFTIASQYVKTANQITDMVIIIIRYDCRSWQRVGGCQTQMELPPLRRGWHIDIDKLAATNFHPLLLCFTIIDDQLACCEDKRSDGIFFLKINQGRRVALSQSQLGHLSPAVIFDIVFKDIVVIIRFFIMTHVLWLKFFDHLVTVPSTLPLSSTPPW